MISVQPAAIMLLAVFYGRIAAVHTADSPWRHAAGTRNISPGSLRMSGGDNFLTVGCSCNEAGSKAAMDCPFRGAVYPSINKPPRAKRHGAVLLQIKNLYQPIIKLSIDN